MAGPATLFQAGDHASRPANGAGCVLYSCTDHDLVYRDDGSSWTTFMTLVGENTIIVQNEGGSLSAAADTLDFVGAGVTASGTGATKTVTIPDAKGLPLGLTGATAVTRYVGGTASGEPAAGTFEVGDFVITQDGEIYICTEIVAGTPPTYTWTGVTGAAPAEILDIPTAETDTALVLAPDGAGGVEFRAETGGTGMADPMTATGDMIYETGGINRSRSALGATADASGQYASWNPSYAIDDSGSDGAHRWGWNGGNSWLRVNLGAEYAIGSFRIILNTSEGGGTLPYILESSTDNSNWTTRYTSTNPSSTDSGVTALAGGPFTARYWRLSITTGQWSGVCYFNLYDAVVPDRLPIGTDNYVLRVATNVPAWEAEFDATAPSTQAFGDSAAAGSAATAARRDHKHAMMGAPTVRQAAGVPSGAPSGTELPIAFDTTASTGGLYVWSGAAWVKASLIP